MTTYMLHPRGNVPDYHSGRAVDVHRDGVHVATVYEDPERTGGRTVYGRAFVSTNPVRWAGERPDEATDLPFRSRPRELAYDFVSASQTAEEAVPEVRAHVEALLAWRSVRARRRAESEPDPRPMFRELRRRQVNGPARRANPPERRPGLVGYMWAESSERRCRS